MMKVLQLSVSEINEIFGGGKFHKDGCACVVFRHEFTHMRNLGKIESEQKCHHTCCENGYSAYHYYGINNDKFHRIGLCSPKNELEIVGYMEFQQILQDQMKESL
jgi:hypothetical protein